MATAILDLDTLHCVNIGISGENESRKICFDTSGWIEEFPSAEIVVVIQRPTEDDPYLCANVTTADGVTTWIPSLADTSIAGQGVGELRCIEGEKIRKSVMYNVIIEESLGTTGEAPGGFDDWLSNALEQMQAVADESAASASDSADSATAAAASAAEAAEKVGESVTSVNGVAAVDNSVTITGSNIAVSDSDETTVESKFSTLETDLDAAEENISTLQTDLDAAEENISTLQTDLDAAEENIEANKPFVVSGTIASGAKTVTISDSRITENTVMVNSTLSNSGYLTADITWTTSAGQIVLSSSATSGDVTVTLVLQEVR